MNTNTLLHIIIGILLVPYAAKLLELIVRVTQNHRNQLKTEAALKTYAEACKHLNKNNLE